MLIWREAPRVPARLAAQPTGAAAAGGFDLAVVGFDKHGVLSHHGWMKNFKSKFSGSRYICIAPRIEITDETKGLPRARRGSKSRANREADLDD